MYIKTTKDLADEFERDEALLRGVAARLRRTARTCSEAHGHLQRQEADALDRILSALQGIETMERALVAAIERFEEYAKLHAAKPDMEKARRNSDMADMLRAALPPPPTKGTSHE